MYVPRTHQWTKSIFKQIMWNKWLFLLSFNKQFLDDIENDTCQSCLERDTYGLLVGTFFYNIRVCFFLKCLSNYSMSQIYMNLFIFWFFIV